MVEEYPGQMPASIPDGDMTAMPKGSPALARTVLGLMKLIGKTAGLASRMADQTAEAIAHAGKKAFSLPPAICSFGSRMTAKGLPHKQMKSLKTELAQDENDIEALCTKMARRLRELVREDPSALPDDAQLAACIAAVQDIETKINDLNSQALSLTEAAKQEESARIGAVDPVEAEPAQQEAKPAEPGLSDKIAAVIRESADGITLAEIGDRLGVNWRTLILPAKGLVEGKQVRKEDRKYLPL